MSADVLDVSTPAEIFDASSVFDAVAPPAVTTPPDAVCKCGASVHPTTPGVCQRGHALPGNKLAWKDGVRVYRDKGDAALPDVLRQSVEEFREGVIADRGGASELSTLEAAYCRRLGETEAVVRLLASDLATRGLFTPRGRVRNTFTRWIEGVAQWDRLAQRIGTDRRARQLPSLSAYLAQARRTVEEPQP
jgi:hypothetical protein